MRLVKLGSHTDFTAFLQSVSGLLREGIPPENVVFQTPGREQDLFAGSGEEKIGEPRRAHEEKLPTQFVRLVRTAGRHRDKSRFALLYRLLWRSREAPGLFTDPLDHDVQLLQRFEQAVRRDAHKMKAFVRFRPIGDEARRAYVAWFEPEHHIVDAIAPFFARRFTAMRWSVLTPLACVHWDGEMLRYTEGVDADPESGDDDIEALWLTYYANIFNPARLKTAAMQAEMPKRYWHNLPEARLIPALTRLAVGSSRVDPPVEQQAPPQLPAALLDATDAQKLDWIGTQLSACQRCPIAECRTRAVAGRGPADAHLALVGEQPGDAEDIAGAPFVGPAGQVLDKAMASAVLDRDSLYLTNAVKHFKYRQRGKRRLHQKPRNEEIEVCRWWLNLELSAVRPKVITALGASAAFALTGKTLDISAVRGRPARLNEEQTLVVTYHPAAVLRAPQERRSAMAQQLTDDLGLAKCLADT